MVFGDKLVDPDISGAGGSNTVSQLVSDEVRTRMMMAIPGVPGEDYPILSSEVSDVFESQILNALCFYCLFFFIRSCHQFCQALNSHVKKKNLEVKIL